jgi:hypothetical protein
MDVAGREAGLDRCAMTLPMSARQGQVAMTLSGASPGPVSCGLNAGLWVTTYNLPWMLKKASCFSRSRPFNCSQTAGFFPPLGLAGTKAAFFC